MGCLACSQPALSLTQTWPLAMGVGGLMSVPPPSPAGSQNPCLELTCFWIVVASLSLMLEELTANICYWATKAYGLQFLACPLFASHTLSLAPFKLS